MKRRKSHLNSSVPVIGFTELRQVINGGHAMGHKDMLDIWFCMTYLAGVSTDSDAQHKFIAKLRVVYTDLVNAEARVDWQELMLMTMNSALPGYTELCVIMGDG